MKQFFSIAAITVATAGYLCNNSVGKEDIYLLPNHYVGPVTIIFNQKNGIPEKYESGKRLYEIPGNGVLLTQFKKDSGWHQFPKYYYLNIDNKRVPIPVALETSQLSPDTIKVYGHYSGMNGNEATKYVRYDMFFVSTKKEVDSLGEVADKLYPLDMIKTSE